MGDVRPDALSPAHAALGERLSARFGERVASEPPCRGQWIVAVAPAELLAVLAFARDELGLGHLSDVTAVDHLERVPRFDVVYQLAAPQLGVRLTVKTRVAPGEAVPSVTELWAGANYPEREVYDLFGIPFEGHPHLARILLPDEFEGHPLRRDFPLGEVEVDFDIPHRKRFSHAPN